MSIYINPAIHPMCVMDEYAIIVRSWVWFIPITPPIRALSPARNANAVVEVDAKTNDIIVSGASFCHEASSAAGFQKIEFITDVNHIWQGAMPIFITRAVSKIKCIMFE